MLYISGLNASLATGTKLLKLRNIYNPYTKGSTNSFICNNSNINIFNNIVETLRPGTNTVVETYTVAGIDIDPGLINNPSIVGSPMNLNMYIDYTIKFTPMNSLPEGGLIEIWFPVEYTGAIVFISFF